MTAAQFEAIKTEQRAAATEAAANTLRNCAPLIAARATSKPLFSGMLKPDRSRRLLCRVLWPGVVQVIDPDTGILMAESCPGNPRELAPGFVPGRPID